MDQINCLSARQIKRRSLTYMSNRRNATSFSFNILDFFVEKTKNPLNSVFLNTHEDHLKTAVNVLKYHIPGRQNLYDMAPWRPYWIL